MRAGPIKMGLIWARHSVLVLALTLGGLGANGAAAQTAATPPPREQRTTLARYPLADDTAQPAQVTGASLFPWSRVVYQSFGNNNWEIYLANDDGTNPLRLTNSGDSDIHPRLNRGVTRIVHASKIGDYEIRAINPDGSGEAILTHNDQDDVSPAWSPDGSRIAFQSYRDGQAEIYLMNSDGSGQTRLTTAADYDGEPAWSPDGGKIAFVSRRTGNYRLWVMNADGSGQAMLSNQNYSANPTWSPDGSQIAYDSDSNGDGWQELWLMNADGGNQHAVLMPSNNTDAWAGSWSPDGRYIAYTLISFVYYQGNWYWTTAYLEAFNIQSSAAVRLSNDDTAWEPDWQSLDTSPPASAMSALAAVSPASIRVSWSGSDAGVSGLRNFDVQVKDGVGGTWVNWLPQTTQTTGDYPGIGGHTYYFRVRARDHSSNLEAWPATHDAVTMVEALPPVTSIQSLPSFARNTLTVQWGGSDPGYSGIQTYDVQYRAGSGGNWQDWQMGTSNTQAAFSGTPGQTYYFRTRATDRAQNVEDWPPGDGDGQVTFYDWQLSGTIRDNAGAPVGGLPTLLNPSALSNLTSDAHGDYTVFALSDALTYTASWSKSGYGVLPATSFTTHRDRRQHLVLPPNDNIVQNWGFESGNLTAWSLAGTITPTISLSDTHSGVAAARLGNPLQTNWADIEYVGPVPAAYAYSTLGFPVMAVDSIGTTHVIWSVQTVTNGAEIYYSAKPLGGNWTSVVNLTGNATGGPAAMVIDHTDTLHVVYSGQYVQKPRNGAWSEPVMMPTLRFGGPYQAQIAVDRQLGVHIAWIAIHVPGDNMTSIGYVFRSAGGDWGEPIVVYNGGHRSISRLDVTMTPDDSFHLIWDHSLTESNSAYHVLSASRSTAGLWSPVQEVAGSGHASPTIASDLSGQVYAAWLSPTGIGFASKATSGSWLAPQTAVAGSGFYNPSLAARDGHLYLAYRNLPDPFQPLNSAIHFAEAHPNDSWSMPVAVSESPAYVMGPALVVEPGGAVHLVWTLGIPSAEGEIHYRGPASISTTETSYISQTLTISPALTSPRLSFWYQVGGAYLSDGSGLTATVNSTPVFSTLQSTAQWTHQSLDLSPWQGQTVTLQFGIRHAGGGPTTWAWLDEIAIGSSYPDVWVTSTSPTARRGELVTYTLNYGNQGGAVANNAQITFTLPAGVTFVSASVPPTSQSPALTWNVGNLAAKSGPSTITVTARVAADVPIPSTLNHSAGAQTSATELETLNNTQPVVTFVEPFLIYVPLVQR